MEVSPDQVALVAITTAAERLERRMSTSLANIKGISLAEYRLLRALADAPRGQVSRVDLAGLVGLTASGVTRALQPLEKIGFVVTVRDERDARRAMASLTSTGQELVADASGVLNDVAAAVFARAPGVSGQRDLLLQLMSDLID